ncbi:unnamed protein product [Miscanthus lutarioriparius]|uniref:Homeobox domain-containing protein n=1 Tax=Miscanthus lutarioriparius TaxID=422564 RepID=A0A811M8Z3_9POAL|nr:unnamed protein product [Miscanthus lutarioriparius]
MATFFSTSTNQRDLAGGGGDMSFHHYTYSDSPAGGLVPFPAAIVSEGHVAHGHGGDDGRDEPGAFVNVNARDGPASGAEMGLQTQLLMANASAAVQHQGLSLSLGTQGVPVSLYQYRQAQAGMAAAASLLSPNQASTTANRNAQGIYIQNSRYLKAARELLDEVVNVRDAIKRKGDKNQQGKDSGGEGKDAETSDDKADEHEGNSSADLQNRVSALMALLDQVDRKYRHYHHQMQIVMSSFDAVQSLRRSLGEKDTSAQGGGLSRLRYIDQQLRQQRAMQQFGMMQQPQHAWRPQRGLPESAVSVLRAWLFEHFLHPYPKDSEKLMLARQTGLSRGQVSNWFINARVRLWKPMIEEMYKEEFGAEMDSHSSSENAQGNKGKADEAISSEDHEEFQSPSSAANAKHGAAAAGHHLSAFKSEAIGGMDAAGVGVGLSSLDGAIGPYATSLNLGAAVGNGGGGLQEAFAHHHGGGDARFVQAYGDMAGLGGYDGGSVSLTLGLQHCNDAGAVPAEQQGLLYGNDGDFEFINGSAEDRQRFGSSQLLHDFVA